MSEGAPVQDGMAASSIVRQKTHASINELIEGPHFNTDLHHWFVSSHMISLTSRSGSSFPARDAGIEPKANCMWWKSCAMVPSHCATFGFTPLCHGVMMIMGSCRNYGSLHQIVLIPDCSYSFRKLVLQRNMLLIFRVQPHFFPFFGE